MGLDMYLYKETYFGFNFNHRREGNKQYETFPNMSEYGIQKKRISHIMEQVAYWRKANHIHQWFVDHVQGGNDDCNPYHVDIEDLEKLVALCRKVLKAKPEERHNLLPTQEGFFFGDTSYGEYYMLDVEETIKQLVPVIEEAKNLDGSIGFVYQSSW